MSVAICNDCNSLVKYRKHIRKQSCECGSKNLTAVSASLSENGTEWIYKDRKGEVRRIRGTS